MGQTKPRYPVMEVAISLEDSAPHTGGTKARKQSGDIIEVRKPLAAIGRQEAHTFLWLRMEGLEENQIARLTDPLTDTDDPESATVTHEKRRYQIPLSRLVQVAPGFNPSLALDPTYLYQPFLVTDGETMEFLSGHPPLQMQGLIRDKRTGKYL